MPFAVAACMYLAPLEWIERGVGLLVGMGLALAASRRPDRALLILIALLPFHKLGLALAYQWLPLSIVRPLGGWKEALALGIVVAAVRDFHNSGRRLDRLDGLALAFIAIAGAYALFGGVFIPDAPGGSEIRFLAFRQTAGFVILALAARHTQFPRDFPAQALRLVVAVGVVVAAVAVFQSFAPLAWNGFVTKILQFPRYEADVLGAAEKTGSATFDVVEGQRVVRVGSVFLSSLSCGFYLVISFAAAVERVRREHARPLLLAAAALIGAGLLVTLTRTAIVGGLLVALLALRPAAGRPDAQRARFAVLLAGLVLLALPLATTVGLTARTVAALEGTDVSSVSHVAASVIGLRALVEHPLGQGLGTSAGVGQRFGHDRVVAENNYLQVGNEIGLPAMAVFIALTVVFLTELRRGSRRHPDPIFAALFGSAVALALGALFLHTWSEFAVSWTVWGLGGAMMSVAAARGYRQADETARPQLWPSRPARPAYQAIRSASGR